jgi:uncharacterized delta-60 repeat protein
MKRHWILLMIGVLGCYQYVFPHPGWGYVVEEWVARYNGPGNAVDAASAIAVDRSGNVYVTGWSQSSRTDYDYATVKYDREGKQLWAARYNGPGNGDDYSYAIAVDYLGNVYVTGKSEGIGTYDDCTTVKYSPGGSQLWVTRYDGPASHWDIGRALAVDSAGNASVTGYSWGVNTYYDYMTIKYNSDGGQVWVSLYNGPGNWGDYAYDVALDQTGNVYVSGWSFGAGATDDYATLKYDPNGTEVWVARYNGLGNGRDNARAIRVDESGYVYVTGESEGGGSSYDFATVRYNPGGTQLWVSRYDGPGNGGDNARALVVDHLGNAYVTGYSMGIGTAYDYATVKYDISGDQQWVSRYNGTENSDDFSSDIALDASENVCVAGWSAGTGSSGDYAALKYDPDGTQLWAMRYNGPGNQGDYANALAVDSQGNVYVTGESAGDTTSSDFATVMYADIPVTLDLSCLTPIVHHGEQLQYTITLINRTPERQTFEYWARAKLPGGGWSPGYIVPPTAVTLRAGQTVTRTVRQTVPGNAPYGAYEYWGHVGPDVNTVWDEEMFDFEVQQ